MKRKLTKRQQDDARLLAVAYCAYFEAGDRKDGKALVYWGRTLLDAQEATGVALLDAENVRWRMSLVESLEEAQPLLAAGKYVLVPTAA